MKQIQSLYLTLKDNLQRVVQAYALPFWTGLTDRERHMLKGLSVCVALLACYLIYMPLKNKVTHENALLLDKQKTLAWMRSAEKARHQGNQLSSQQSVSAAQALSIFSQSLDGSLLHDFSYELQQLDQNTLQLSFQKVPYQLFMQWIQTVDKRYRFEVKTFSAQKTDRVGVVQLSIMLAFAN